MPLETCAHWLVQSHSQAVVCWLGGLEILHILTRRLTSTEGVHGGLLSGTGGGDYSTGAEAWGDHCRGRSPAAAAEGWGRRQLPVCATPGGAKWRGEVAGRSGGWCTGDTGWCAGDDGDWSTVCNDNCCVARCLHKNKKHQCATHSTRLVFNTRAPHPASPPAKEEKIILAERQDTSLLSAQGPA